MSRKEPLSWTLFRILIATAVFASSCVLPWLATQTPPPPTPDLMDEMPGAESVPPTAIPEIVDDAGPIIDYPEYEEEPYIPPPPSILDATPELPEKAQGEPVDLHLFATPGQIAYDGFVTFSAIVTNDSAETLTDLLFVDELEAGFSFLPDVNQSVVFDANTNTIRYTIDQLAPGEQVAFNYTLQVTAPSSSPKGELWVHVAEVNSKDNAVALKASAELWVGQPALQSNIEVARLDKDGGWAETENASIYIEPNALQQDAIAVISPVAVASGPDLQFQVELYETENALEGDYDGLAEQQLAVTDEVSNDLAIPAFMEVDFDDLGDLDALPGGKEPFVTTYIPELDVWVKMPPTLVDYENNTVTVETDHFSTWGAGIGDSLPQNGANVLLFDQPYTSLFTGSARYSIPIWTPPGRGDMQPGVSLSYSSATVDGVLGDVQAPWVGVGWNMDAIEIVRKIDTDEDGYGYVDEYSLTFNGTLHELIQDENNPERYYTKRASFLYIERHNEALGNAEGVENATKEWWEVVATDGTRYRIGWNTDAEQLTLMYGYKCITGNPCDTPEEPYDNLGYAGAAENLVAMRWRVDRVVDTNGNFIEYNYTEHGPAPASQVPEFDLASYLASIEYTGHLDSQGVEDLAPGYKMEFNTEERVGDDNPTDFGIWDHWDTQQLASIKLYCTACSGLASTAIRTYDFEYSAPAAPNANGTLVLDSITISGGGFTESSQSIPSTTAATVSFTYANKDNRAVTGEDNAWSYPRLTVIDNGYGASLNYSYENDGRGTNSWYNWRASEVRVKSDFNGAVTDAAIQKYSYSGVQYTNEGGASLGSLIGYSDVTETSYETDGTTKILDAVHKFGTLGLDTGRELWTEMRDPSNSNVLRKSSNTFFTDNSEAPFVGWEYRYLSETKSYVRIGSTLSLVAKTFYQRDPSNGNLLVQMDYLGGTLSRKQVYEYRLNTNPDVYILDRVSRVRIKDPSDNTLSETQYQYDNTATAPSKGNLTQTQSATGLGTDTVDSSYIYDAYGNVTSVSSYETYGSFGATPSGTADTIQTTSTTYESTFRTYPTTVTNDLLQSAETRYLYTLGMPYEVEDLNDWVTKTSYDGLGRVLSSTSPGFGSATVKYTYPTVSSGEVSAPYAIKMEIWDTMPTTDVYRPVWGFYDGLGRILQQQVQGGTKYLVTYTDFNEQGLVGKQSVPVEQTGTGGSYLTPTWANMDHTSTSYDLLGRVTQVTAPGNLSTSTSYDGLTTTVTNPNGEKISRELDGLGRLIKVQEWQNQGANVYATTLYYYDIFDRLTRVRDAQLNGTDIAYDWLGRKTSMDDPDMGAWSYEYGPHNTLTKQTDARDQVLLFAYDDLNRLTNKYKDSITLPNQLASYTYGTTVGTNLGMRTAMTDESGSTARSYSNYARSVTETRTIDTNNYTFTTTTDWLGRPITITYPDSEVVTYSYDDFGRADSVSGSTVGDLADIAYNFLGQLDTITLDNGIVIDHTYDADNFRLTDRVAQKTGSAAVIDFDYGYDSNGNITTLDDNVLGHDFTFEYDHLNRLTSADEDSTDGYAYRQTYEYDQVGNILNVDEWLEDIIFSDDFEGTDLSNWSETPGSGHPSLSTSAKYEALKGLLVQSDNTSSEARYLTNDSPLGEAEYHARFYFDPNTVTMTLNDSHTIFDGLDGLNRRFVVEMRYANDGQNDVFQLRAGAWDDTSAAFSYGNWNTITDAWHEVEVHWEGSTGAGNDDGFMFFYLEGVEVDLIDTLDNDGQRITDVRLGLVEGVDTATDGDLYFDAFESRRDTFIGLFPIASLENQVVVVPQHNNLGAPQAFSDVPAMYGRPAPAVLALDEQVQVESAPPVAAYAPPPRPLFVTILNDDFENNNFNAWTSATIDGGDLSTSAASAREGSYGMQALVDDTNTINVYDDSLTAETRYRARFYFDPNSMTIANWDQMVIFQDEDGYMKVWLNYGNGDYSISIEVYNDSASGTESDWVTITDDWHAIEIDWKASSGAGNDDGHLTLYIDGTQEKQISTVDNDTHSLGGVKLGLPSGTGSGTSGTLYFDAFESDDADYIGLLPAATPTNTPTPTNTATNTPIPPSIAGEWHFDEGSGTTAADDSGNNNDATLYNSTGWTSYGLSDDALLLDGTDDYARADAANALKPADSLSLAVWIYPDAASEDDIIINYHDTGDEYGFRTDSDGFVEFHLNDLDPQLVSGPILPQDQWSHVIGVYDKTENEIRLYVNGILVSSRNVTGSISYAAGDGLNFSDASKPFSGRLDEVYLYDEALTQAEIDDLYGLSPTPVPTATPTLEHTYTPTPTVTSTPTATVTATATATVDPAALRTDLVAYWHLDEVSGSRADEVGTNDLTDGNTVEQEDGILGWSADFSATSSESLHVADNADVSVNVHQNKSWAGWIKVESFTSQSVQYILSKWNDSGYGDYSLALDNIDKKLDFTLRKGDSSGNITLTASTQGSLNLDEWYFVYLYHDADNDEIGISVNDGTVDSTALSAGIIDTAQAFYMGRWKASGSYYFDGQLDEWAIWNRVLTTSEVTALYNAGDGLQYPFDGSPAPTPTPTPEPYISLDTGLLAYWDLDEASGKRVDGAGTNDLTDGNTVAQGTGLVGNSADFEYNNSESLHVADNADVSVATHETKAWAGWIKVESFTAQSIQYIFSKWNDSGYGDYSLSLDNNDKKLDFTLRKADSSGNITLTASSHGALNSGEWYFVYVYHDEHEDEIGISVNNGTVDTLALSTGIIDTSQAFNMGRWKAGGSYYFDGEMDEWAIWDRTLTTDELSYLYNGGSGQGYPFSTEAQPTPTPVPSSLLTDLTAYWYLDEVSGTRADEVGTNDLTDGNTVEQEDGILGWSADFSATSSESLHVSDNADVSVNVHQNKSWAGWIKVESFTSQSIQYIISKWNDSGYGDYSLALDNIDKKLDFTLRKGDSTGNITLTASTHGALNLGEWYFVYLYHDADNDEIGISVNDGTVDTTALSAGIIDTTQAFYMGRWKAGGTYYYDGQMDEWGIWNRVLTTAEVTALYNAGDGLQYPFDGSPAPTPTPTPEPYISLDTGLLAYWDLDEASGTRDDAAGTNDLTDDNTVGQGTGLVGNSADFEYNNSEALYVADNIDVSVATHETKAWAGWIKLESFTAQGIQNIISKWNDGNITDYSLRLDNNDKKLDFIVRKGDSSGNLTLTASTHGALNLDEWYFVYMYHDEHEDEIGISVNNGTVDTAFLDEGIKDTTQAFYFGRWKAGGSYYFDGEMDEWAIWDRTLTAEELSYLYNEGDGQAYPFTEPPIAPEDPAPKWINHEYSYDANHPHAVSQVVRNRGGLGQFTDTYSYDANGNMTCRIEDGVTWRQTYNEENRLSKVEEVTSGTCASGTTGDTWTFTYDGNGTRIRQVNPDSTITLFLGGGMYTVEDASGTSANTKYYRIAGQRIAMREGSDTSFLITDHLGSVVAVTDDTGALVANSQQRYMAFGGELLEADSPTDFGYTGQRSNTGDFGLMDYNARWYSPKLGRFTQPDTIVPAGSMPQSFNRYSYVYNNPISLNDPSGHDPGEPTNYRDRLAKFRRNRLKNRFGINLTRDEGAADWTFREISSAYIAAKLVDRMLRRFTKNHIDNIEAEETGATAFSDVFETFSNPLTINKLSSGSKDGNACRTNPSGTQIDCFARATITAPLLIHEFGHVFDFRRDERPSEDWGQHNLENEGWIEKPNGFKEENPDEQWSGLYIYYMSPDNTNGEEFADMFLALTMDWWAEDAFGELTEAAEFRKEFMESQMPTWISN